MKERTSALGVELAVQRKRQGMSIRKLAEMTGRNRSYLSEIERGNRVPSVKLLEDIAQVLEVNRNVLLRHIHLLKLDFVSPSAKPENKDLMADLTPRQAERVRQYIRYLKYEQETNSFAESATSQSKYNV